jgi:hypothetical protein
MRLTSRPAQTPLEQRRELARRRRAGAESLGQAFPDVERIRIKLTFEDPADASPAPQTHDLFPPATLVLEFPCPHGDCDGSFDLTDVAVGLLAGGTTVAKGESSCRGSRSAPQMGRKPCALGLRYHIAAIYRDRRD